MQGHDLAQVEVRTSTKPGQGREDIGSIKPRQGRISARAGLGKGQAMTRQAHASPEL